VGTLLSTTTPEDIPIDKCRLPSAYTGVKANNSGGFKPFPQI
jgi:hypothetical protein